MFAISHHTSFFLFEHTTCEFFMDLYQTVLKLPHLTSFSHLHSIVTVYAFLFVTIAGAIIGMWILCHPPSIY